MGDLAKVAFGAMIATAALGATYLIHEVRSGPVNQIQAVDHVNPSARAMEAQKK